MRSACGVDMGNRRAGAKHAGIVGQAGVSLAVALVRVYEYTLRPVLGPSCRFIPSCSEYAREALRAHGLGKGLLLGAHRLCRCHPFQPGGLDEVPPRVHRKA